MWWGSSPSPCQQAFLHVRVVLCDTCKPPCASTCARTFTRKHKHTTHSLTRKHKHVPHCLDDVRALTRASEPKPPSAPSSPFCHLHSRHASSFARQMVNDRDGNCCTNQTFHSCKPDISFVLLSVLLPHHQPFTNTLTHTCLRRRSCFCKADARCLRHTLRVHCCGSTP